ncbi:hypothetical protein EXIGLDRAFT_768046 [Exidia glandulosa HHB12029]|uniref:Uncharacterized protein n=1 Tax=Exidia glandulosa HHB12029 TaxID=1314781 RepID=A0A165IH58_EXIGL|nr:hypothetical protein EXIGLDRAFT_768046 [Exidia glandulosa HHB12029]
MTTSRPNSPTPSLDSLRSSFTPSPSQSLSEYPGDTTRAHPPSPTPMYISSELFRTEADRLGELLEQLDARLRENNSDSDSASSPDSLCSADSFEYFADGSLSSPSIDFSPSPLPSATLDSSTFRASAEASSFNDPCNSGGDLMDLEPSSAADTYVPPHRRAEETGAASSTRTTDPRRVFFGPDESGAFATSLPPAPVQPTPPPQPASNDQIALFLAALFKYIAASPTELALILDRMDEEAKLVVLSILLNLRPRNMVQAAPIQVSRIVGHAVRSCGLDYHCQLANGRGTTFVRDTDLHLIENSPQRVAAYWRNPQRRLADWQIRNLLSYPQYANAEGDWLRRELAFGSSLRHRPANS